MGSGDKKGDVTVIDLRPSQSMFLPVGQLPRVFIGIGWQEKNPGNDVIDVDCSCNTYSQGKRNDDNTVWYAHKANPQKPVPNGKGGTVNASTIVHTGDILSGQRTSGQLEDLERIYVYLAALDHACDCL